MNLPPIAAIRVFECAARLGNFTKAGEELGMTQAAVSYQIKILEERLGVKLFVRKARQVELTVEGRKLSQSTSQAFTLLKRAFDEVRQDSAQILTLSVLPTFCTNWLVPRLHNFQALHPDLAVRVESTPKVADLFAGSADIGIRTGAGNWPGLAAHFLFTATASPLMSRAAYETYGPFETPRDLLKLRIIGDMWWWREWFKLAGDPDAPLPDHSVLELESQTMEVAATLGTPDGVVMATPAYFARELEQKILVAPFQTELDGLTHWLTYDESKAHLSKIKAFRDWILFDPNAFCLGRMPSAQS
ncbi:LysR family transcriptional regulator [Woodsholea maritima]|uniref:LysR family transcriptional regulator n=1 Tax=Woodsholea maritima TaxID=240237 RepID=UPI0003809862|nr:LysR family transcriptional regulator [Woodsholea maritima]